MAMLFDTFVLEHKSGVQQPPKCERSLALKNRPKRENWQEHYNMHREQREETGLSLILQGNTRPYRMGRCAAFCGNKKGELFCSPFKSLFVGRLLL
jgi:hypothetical protein